MDRRSFAALVEFDRVSVLYPTTDDKPSWALNEVSLSIADGDFVCAVGPSGCGKTTLLNLIAGFIQPTRGTVSLSGRTIDGPGADRGVVFQEYGLFPWLSVRRNIAFGPWARRVDRGMRNRLVDEYLTLVGLTRAADRYPFELSGGMRQRVAFARALVNKPRILLMDEPFAAVDAMTRSVLQDELVKLWQRERFATFFITHSVEEAVYLGTTVVVMSPHPGRIVQLIPVGLPHPRDRENPDFRHLIRSVQSALGHHA